MPEEPAATARGGPGKAGGQGRIASHSEAGGGSGDRRRVGPEKRPKSSREGSGGPQESSRDKRPLSGPDVGTPQPAGLASGAKLAAGRPFNTYPRADTDHPSRGAQVTHPLLQGPAVPCPLLLRPHLPAPPCHRASHPDHPCVCPIAGSLSCSGSRAGPWNPSLTAASLFCFRGSLMTWPPTGHQRGAWPSPSPPPPPPGLPPEPEAPPALECWAPTPRSPSWPLQPAPQLPPLPLPCPGPLAPARHSGSRSEYPMSSSGLPCSWWWTQVTPAPTWTTSSRLARVPRALCASPPCAARASLWPSRRWTCASSRGESCSSTRCGHCCHAALPPCHPAGPPALPSLLSLHSSVLGQPPLLPSLLSLPRPSPPPQLGPCLCPHSTLTHISVPEPQTQGSSAH